MSAKHAINDKLQGSVATYLRCGGVVNNQNKKGLLLSLWVKIFFKSVTIWQSYKLERDCLVHFLRLLAVCRLSVQTARLFFCINRQYLQPNKTILIHFQQNHLHNKDPVSMVECQCIRQVRCKHAHFPKCRAQRIVSGDENTTHL